MRQLNRRDLMNAALIAVGSTATTAADAVRGEAAQSEPGPMDHILLKDYRPRSSLVVPETHLPKARFPAIDVHAHPYAETPNEIAQWVRTMEAVGVERTIVLTGATGAEFDRLVEMFVRAYPARVQLYCGIDTTEVDALDYPQRAVAELVRCYERGARGVGEVSDKGSGLTRGRQRPRDRRLHVDDPRLDPFWERCAELHLPVNLHIADHPSAWQPPDERQERTPNFQRFN